MRIYIFKSETRKDLRAFLGRHSRPLGYRLRGRTAPGGSAPAVEAYGKQDPGDAAEGA